MASSDPRRSGNPATRAAAAGSPRATATRGSVNARSRGLLVRMARLPPLVIPGAMLVLMLVGLMAPLPVALPALGVIAAFVAWLAYISWPIIDTRGRVTRAVMLATVLGSALARIQGWL